MRISVVIPVLNASAALRSTLQSIRSAGGAGVEIVVQDGGSRDGIQSVLDEFPEVVSIFSSGRDGGQYAAINRGFELAGGDVLAWLNAGDIFLPGVFDKVVEIFEAHPDIQWLTGRQCIARHGNPLIFPARDVMVANHEIRFGLCDSGRAGFLQQEGMFWRRELWDACGGLDSNLKLAADFDLWMRMARIAPLHRASVPFAAFSYDGDNRSVLGAVDYRREIGVILEKHGTSWRALRFAVSGVTVFLNVTSRVSVLRPVLLALLYMIGFPRVETLEWRRKGELGSFDLKRRRRVSWAG